MRRSGGLKLNPSWSDRDTVRSLSQGSSLDVGHQPSDITAATMSGPSREAAREYSPRRKPWVQSRTRASPEGAKGTSIQRVLPPKPPNQIHHHRQQHTHQYGSRQRKIKRTIFSAINNVPRQSPQRNIRASQKHEHEPQANDDRPTYHQNFPQIAHADSLNRPLCPSG